MDDTICGAKWECYSGEWPPVMAICMGCGVIFRLIAHDHQSDELSFRRLT